MDIVDFVTQVTTLISAHGWLALVALGIGLLVRLSKADVTWFPNVPPQYRAWGAVALGVAAGVVDSLVKGAPLATALMQGLAAAMMAITGHETIVEGMRGGRDIGVPKSSTADQRGRASLVAMGLAVIGLFGLVAFMHGCAFLKKEVNSPTGKTIRDAAVVACQIFAQGQAPKMGVSLNDAIAAFCSTDALLEPWIEAQGVAQKTGERLALSRLSDAGIGDAATDH